MLDSYLNKNSFVELILSEDIPEENISSNIPFIKDEKVTILELYTLIQRIKKNSSSGIIIKIKNLNIGFARADEIRSLLLDLRKCGKKVIAYLEEAGNIEYFIASAADQIYIPPWATLNVVGLKFDSFFIRELLSNLDIEPEIDGFGEYKSAADMFNRNDMSPHHKEMMETVLENYYNNFVNKISVERNLTAAELKKLIDKNPLSPENAKQNRLIDEILYENDIQQRIDDAVSSKAKIIKYKTFKRNYRFANIYKELFRLVSGKKKYIGYININGMITQGKSKKGSGYVNTCGSDTANELINKAGEDKSVTAVIIRVLSPGGSALASDLIRNEIENLQKLKPVYISMSDVAASGGYMVSLSSDKIFANPFTITGSIGVVAGKFNFKSLLNRYGIYNETLKKGKMANMYSTSKSFSAEEKKRFTQLIKDMYEEFVKLVSEKRNINTKQTEKAAKGRVWTSEDSFKMGLIDSTGTLNDVVNEIKFTTGTDEDDITYFKEFKTKNKLSLSNLGKLSRAGMIDQLFGVYDVLKKERIYAIMPFSFKIR